MQLFALKNFKIWCIWVNLATSKSDFGTRGERNLLSAGDYVKPLKYTHSTTGRLSRVARKNHSGEIIWTKLDHVLEKTIQIREVEPIW